MLFLCNRNKIVFTVSRVYFYTLMNNQWIPCPYCGEPIKANATACTHCGSDEKTGWSDKTYLDGIDTGDYEPDYADAVAKEFPAYANSSRPENKKNRWQVVVGGLLLVVALLYLVRTLL